MELASYRRQVERIKADVAATQEEIDDINHLLVSERRSGNQLERLQEIAATGRAMLTEPDIPLANAYFRRLFRVTVENGRVISVETL